MRTWTNQGRVESFDTIRCHNDLDVSAWIEPIQLVQQLQHGTLDFTLTARRGIVSWNKWNKNSNTKNSNLESRTNINACRRNSIDCKSIIINYLFAPTASISSIKTMEGACSSATRNSSRTNFGPSPKYFWMSSDPTTRKNVADVWFATALASSVFPKRLWAKRS